MDKEEIIRNEKENDGQTVYMYYDPMVGVYAAYGLSAYYATMVVNTYSSYSYGVEMPVTLLRRVHVNMLRQSLKMEGHEKSKFYVFKLKEKLGDAGYQRWKEKVLEQFHNLKQ